MDKKQEKIIKETADKLLEMLGVKAEVSIELKSSPADTSTEADQSVEVSLTTEDTGMLIGYHGETLEALQLILSLCVAKQLGTFVRVSVEIGEYKKNRTDYLRQLVEQTKAQVLEQKEEVSLSHLKAWERREVHMLIHDDPDVVSESTGEGRDRVLTIRPK
jgi:spoIIIJ-associated protein